MSAVSSSISHLSARHASALALLVLGVLMTASPSVLDGDRAKYVHVRWRPEVAANTRAGLEARFSLREQRREGQSFGYDLLDDSTSNIRALLQHPAVEDTHDLDRQRMTVAATAEDGDSNTGLAWRWGVEDALPYALPIGILLLASGALGLTASQKHLNGIARLPALRLPALGPVGFGAFRIALSMMLSVLLLHNGIDDGFLPLEQQRHLPLPFTGWIHTLAAIPGATGMLQGALCVALVLFAAGVFAQASFVAIVVGFNVWFCMWALRAGTHPLGTLPLALIALVIVPWGEGIGVDRWRSGSAGKSRVPYGYAPWVLALALGVGFTAASFAKMRSGLDWVSNGTVRYHFMAEAEIAMVTWGLWIAARPAVAVLVSAGAVIGETVVILGAFAGPVVRLAFGAVAASLLIGFILFHAAVWPAWWVLLLGFLPWEWIDTAAHRITGDAVPPRRLLTISAAVLATLLVGQQIVISWANREIAPFFSAYDMYSATFSSPEQFERANGGPRFRVLVQTTEREYDVGDCVRANRPAIDEMEQALRQDGIPAALPVAEKSATGCAAAIPDASTVRVIADQREFDWERGRTSYRYRDRLVGQWPVRR